MLVGNRRWLGDKIGKLILSYSFSINARSTEVHCDTFSFTNEAVQIIQEWFPPFLCRDATLINEVTM